eukprot:GHVN01069547.1.p1 GENE.GHVN01069547.1~~GHVN01069547.1.p1  ORF type:complete len:107 (+),score=11.95 GHVN01069547.1:167-487(+)
MTIPDPYTPSTTWRSSATAPASPAPNQTERPPSYRGVLVPHVDYVARSKMSDTETMHAGGDRNDRGDQCDRGDVVLHKGISERVGGVWEVEPLVLPELLIKGRPFI